MYISIKRHSWFFKSWWCLLHFGHVQTRTVGKCWCQKTPFCLKLSTHAQKSVLSWSISIQNPWSNSFVHSNLWSFFQIPKFPLEEGALQISQFFPPWTVDKNTRTKYVPLSTKSTNYANCCLLKTAVPQTQKQYMCDLCAVIYCTKCTVF